MIQHHPDDATLVSYASGALSSNFSEIVSAHLELCPHCRQKVREAETIGAAMLDKIEPKNSGSFDFGFEQLWQSVSKQPSDKAEIKVRSARSPKEILDNIQRDHSWRALAPGISQIVLPAEQGENLRLLRIQPGMTMPLHGHHGSEMTMILQGSYSDELGRFRAGDVADVDDDTEHQPIADGDQACICLIATEAPLKFKGFLPKLLQPIVGL